MMIMMVMMMTMIMMMMMIIMVTMMMTIMLMMIIMIMMMSMIMMIYLCNEAVALYIELLLTNTSLSFNVTTISRLSEDLSLMKSLFDELRIKLMLASGNRHHVGSKVSRPQSQHTASNTVNDIISKKNTPMILSAEVIDNDDNDDDNDNGDNSEQGTSTTQTKTQ